MDTGVKATIAVVLVLIVGWWIFISQTDGKDQKPGKQSVKTPKAIPERLVLKNGLEILFSKQVRCDDAAVNQFVSSFLTVLAAKDYKNYRLMVTQQREPIGKKKFEDAYDRMSKIEVTGIEKIEDTKILKATELQMEPPAYRLKAHAVLRDNSERDVEIIVFNESGTWVSSN
jgi:hypothetical protein